MIDDAMHVVESALRAFNAGDAQGFLDHIDDEVRFWMNGSPKVSALRNPDAPLFISMPFPRSVHVPVAKPEPVKYFPPCPLRTGTAPSWSTWWCSSSWSSFPGVGS